MSHPTKPVTGLRPKLGSRLLKCINSCDSFTVIGNPGSVLFKFDPADPVTQRLAAKLQELAEDLIAEELASRLGMDVPAPVLFKPSLNTVHL